MTLLWLSPDHRQCLPFGEKLSPDQRQRLLFGEKITEQLQQYQNNTQGYTIFFTWKTSQHERKNHGPKPPDRKRIV